MFKYLCLKSQFRRSHRQKGVRHTPTPPWNPNRLTANPSFGDRVKPLIHIFEGFGQVPVTYKGGVVFVHPQWISWFHDQMALVMGIVGIKTHGNFRGGIQERPSDPFGLVSRELCLQEMIWTDCFLPDKYRSFPQFRPIIQSWECSYIKSEGI